MKIAVIWSSANTDGLTASAKDNLISGLQQSGAEIDEIYLNAYDIHVCKACGNGWGTCRSQGTCVITDDFSNLYHRLTDADAIAIVSAVYWHDVTERLKLFIDRLRRCDVFTNKFLAGRHCFLVACAGGTGRGPIKCLHNLEDSMNHMGLSAFDRIPITRYNKTYMLPTLNAAGASFTQYISKFSGT